MQFFLLKRCLQMTTTFVCKPSSFAENYLANLKRHLGNPFSYSQQFKHGKKKFYDCWKAIILFFIKSFFLQQSFFIFSFSTFASLPIFLVSFPIERFIGIRFSKWNLLRHHPKAEKTIERLKVSFLALVSLLKRSC